MLKNTASQIIGAQLVSATDGSAFTGSVTVAVTGDGGTQATGSVGSGACTHEGNGFHTYAPAQAETNYDHIAFTFTGSGAVPVTVQVYTGTAAITAPSNFSSLAIDGSGRIQVQSGTSTGQISATSGVPNVNVLQVSGDATAADNLEAAFDGTGYDIGGLDVSEVNAIVDDLINGGRLDLLIDAIKAKTDSLTFTQTGQVDANVQRINDVTIVGDGSGTPFNV